MTKNLFFTVCSFLAGKQDATEVVVASLEVVPDRLGTLSRVMVEVCAYAGENNIWQTGNSIFLLNRNIRSQNDVLK